MMRGINRIAALSVIGLGLAGCIQGDDPMPPPDTAGDTCGAGGYAGLVGKNIAAVTLPADLETRLTGDGRMVTMDFRPTRMNIEVGADGVIDRVYCG